MLEALARHPAAAHHIATKLARYFIADDPPSDLVEALEISFLESDGDLLQLYDTLVDHPQSWSPAHKAPSGPLDRPGFALDHAWSRQDAFLADEPVCRRR